MIFLFRCDSSFTIGSGHISRCVNLAEQLWLRNHEIVFACRQLEGNIINLVKEKQFKVLEMPSHKGENIVPLKYDYSTWSEVNTDTEIREFRQIIDQIKPHWIIVDHYSYGEFWENDFRDCGAKILAIDDLQRIHKTEAVLDQNFRLSSPLQETNSQIHSRSFLGPEYSLLSGDFLKRSPKEWKDLKYIKNAVVFFGGSDPTNETLRFSEILEHFPKNIHFSIVIGSQNKDLEQIQQNIKRLTNATVHIQTKKMAELLHNSELFIGSGGTVTWERSKFGLPSIVITVAENQVKTCVDLSKINAHLYLGSSHEIDQQKLIQEINIFIQNEDLRKTMHKNSLNLKVSDKLNDLLEFLEKN